MVRDATWRRDTNVTHGEGCYRVYVAVLDAVDEERAHGPAEPDSGVPQVLQHVLRIPTVTTAELRWRAWAGG
jgi:hypothetical protein